MVWGFYYDSDCMYMKKFGYRKIRSRRAPRSRAPTPPTLSLSYDISKLRSRGHPPTLKKSKILLECSILGE